MLQLMDARAAHLHNKAVAARNMKALRHAGLILHHRDEILPVGQTINDKNNINKIMPPSTHICKNSLKAYSGAPATLSSCSV